MRKYRNDLKVIKLCNGGSANINGQNVCFVNTCTIDYWLLAIYLVLDNSNIAKERILSKSSTNTELNSVLDKIKSFLLVNDWNEARLEWTNFIGLKGKLQNGTLYYDYYTTLSTAFVDKWNQYQLFTFDYKCKKSCQINGDQKTESSHEFYLK
jgi:hypothetical protein